MNLSEQSESLAADSNTCRSAGVKYRIIRYAFNIVIGNSCFAEKLLYNAL